MNPIAPLLLPLLAQASAGGADSALLRAVPEDALLVVSTDSWSAIRARAEDNAWVRFFHDPELEGFVASVKAALPEEEMEEQLLPEDFSFPALLDAVDGRVAAFLSANGEELHPLGGVLVELGKGSDAFYEAIAPVLAKVDEDPATVHETRGDAHLRYREQEGEEGDFGTVLVLESDALFGFLFGRGADEVLETAQGVLDRYDGSDPSEGFLRSRLRAEAGSGAPGARAVEVLLSVERLVEAVMKDADEEPEPEDLDLWRDVGFLGLRWLALDLDLGPGEELQVGFRMHVPPHTLLDELLGKLGTVTQADLLLAPPDAITSSFYRFDLWSAYQAVKSFVKGRSEETATQWDLALATSQAQYGIDVEGSLLSRLDGRFVTCEVPIPSDEAQAANPMIELPEDGSLDRGAVTFLGLTDAGVVEATLDKALELFGIRPMVKNEDFQGHRTHVLDLGLQGFHWSFLPDGLAFSSTPTPLRELLRVSGSTPGEGGLESATLAALRPLLGKSAMVGITDNRATIAAALGGLGMFEQLAAMAGPAEEDKEVFEALAKIDWPDAAVARRYFHGKVISSLRKEGERLLIESRSR